MPHVVRAHRAGGAIVVIGAGPAGLEAARVSAERGHEVILHEAASQAGGQVRLAARVARRAELIGIVDWRARASSSGSGSCSTSTASPIATRCLPKPPML